MKIFLFFICAFFLLERAVLAKVYLTKEKALAIAFQDAQKANLHEINIDPKTKETIQKKLGEKIDPSLIQIYSGELKSGGRGVAMFDSVIGKHELIDYMVVIDQKAEVRLIEILAYRESYGGEIRREHWRKQFMGKSEKEPPIHQKNIVNISGATLSCSHVTEGVQKLLLIANAYAKELGIESGRSSP